MQQPESIPMELQAHPNPPAFLYDTKNQKRIDNPALLQTSPFYFGFDESGSDSVVTLSANSSQNRFMSSDQSGMIDVRTISAVATSFEFTAKITDTKINFELSNRPLHAKTLFGTQGRPFRLPYPIVLPKTQNLNFLLTDLSGSSNSIRLTCHGFKYYFDAENVIYRRLPLHSIVSSFFYTTDTDVSLAGSASDVNYIKIETHDFLAYGITAYSTGAFLLKISDVNLGRAFQNGYIHSSHLGIAEYQNNWDQPILIKKKTQLRFDFTNLTGSTNNIYLNLFGVAIRE